VYQIYKITNTINGKSYIGKTKKTFDVRFKEHIQDSKRDRCKDRPLYRAMNKYGVDAFTIELIEETDNPVEREKHWIDVYGTYGSSGYNATKGGDGKEYVDLEKVVDCLFENNLDHMVVSRLLKHDRSTIIDIAKKVGIYIPIVRRRGEDNPSSVLTRYDVKKIRELYVPGVFGWRRIAKLLNLPEGAVHSVIHNNTWNFVRLGETVQIGKGTSFKQKRS
jgi:hypothetical protein